MTQKVIDFKVRYDLQKKKESIAASINQLQDEIADYRINELPNILSHMIDELNSLLHQLSRDHQKLMLEIFELLNTSLENHDYLLFSDVLEDELLRLLRTL